jgi:hypothetical protein
MTSAVKDGADANGVIFDSVIDRERKPTGKAAVQTENHAMNASVKYERVDVRVE